MPPDHGEQNSEVRHGPLRHWTKSRSFRLVALFATGLLLVVIVCCGILLTFINSEKGHRYLLGLAQREATDALGVPVQVEGYTLHLTTLSADLYGIRIAGASPHPDPPLLQVDHLKVGVRVVSLLSRTWYFDQIQIDHPVAFLIVDKNGVSNLPVFKSEGSSHTSVFDLGIRHIELGQGEIYYNSRPYALAADLHDLAFNSTYSSLFNRYSGKVAYSNGKLTFGALRPLHHSLESEFDATPTTFTLKRGTVTAGPSSAIVSATIDNYGDPKINAQYQIVLDGKQAAQILNEPTMPAGSVQTSGSLQFQQLPSRTALQSLVISGSLASARLALTTPTARATVANLSALYGLADGNASLTNLRAKVMGGGLTGDGTMQAIGGNAHSTVHMKLHEVSLAELEHSFGRTSSVKSVSMKGAADATATATWGKTIDDLIAHADVTLQGNASRTSLARPVTAQGPAAATAAPEQTIPLQGAFHVMYSNAAQSLALSNSFLRSSRLNVQLNGTVSRQSSLSVAVQADDLGEVATLVDVFRASGANAPATNLKGQASFRGSVRGSTTSPDLSGQLAGENLEYNGTKWRQLTAGVEVSASRASVQNLRLEGMEHGSQIAGTATIDLHDWSPTRDSAMQIDLTASEIPSTTIANLAGTSIPVTGALDASAHLHGPVTSPMGNASVRLTKATAFGEPISQAKVDLTGSGKEVKASATVQLPAGTIEAQLTTDPYARTYSGELTSSGIDLTKLETMKARSIDARGTVALRAQGEGSYDDPAMDAVLEIPTLTISGQTISKTKLAVNEAHHVANVTLASAVAGANVQGKAQVTLQGDYMVDGSLDLPAMPIQPLLAAFDPDEDGSLTGQLELHATVHGPLKNKNQLQAQVKIPILKVAYGSSVQLAASPIEADYQDGLVRLQPVDIRGTDTELNVQGAFPIDGHGAASLQAHGSVDLQIAQIFEPDLRASGKLKVNVDSRGAIGEGLLNGEIDIADANVATTTSPVGLQHANGVLKLTSDRLVVTKFDGVMGSGTVTAQGAVIYRPNIQINLGVAVKEAQILYPQGVRETADASLRLSGTPKHATLGGAFTLTNLSFTPAFDLNGLINQISGSVEAVNTGGFQQNLQLNIAVNSTNNTSLSSRTLSVDGSANLQIRGTAAEPVVLGRVNLTSGDVILNGNRFVLTGGTVQFINPAMTEPVLNVSLTTDIKEYKIDLRFRGTAEQLRTQYTSTPSLPQADIINLLAFGQTTEASAMNSTPMNQQAEGLVASQVASQVTSRLSKAAGISQLSISPVLAGGTTAGPPGANLTIQQRVTGNLFVTFSTNVATTQGQTIQGQYRVSPRVTVSATRDPNGGFALDTLIKKSW